MNDARPFTNMRDTVDRSWIGSCLRFNCMMRQAALGIAVVFATLLLAACAPQAVEVMPGDRFDLTGPWAVVIPEGAEGVGQVYDPQGSGDLGPRRGLTVFRNDDSWSVNVYSTQDLDVLQQRVSQADNVLSEGEALILGSDASVIVSEGEASGGAFRVLHVLVRTGSEEGLHISGHSEGLEQAVIDGLTLNELADIAVEECGLQKR